MVETPFVDTRIGPFRVTYGYFRSAEARQYSLEGQDSLTLVAGDNVLSFALCDGVGQSFCGELAATALSTTLAEFLFSNWPASENLAACLQEAAWLGRRAVDGYVVDENSPVILQSVLEKKRCQGSETTLIAGRVELLPDGQVAYTFAGLGDSRLVWQAGECTTSLPVITAHRWSTHRGLVGVDQLVFNSPHSCNQLKLRCYSDGLASLDQTLQQMDGEMNAAEILRVSQAVDSDDISFLQVEVRPACQG
jgi:hypothetical protein